jgi:hypothetical protein
VGTKRIVAGGLLAMAAFYAWVSTGSATTTYATIAVQMVLFGTGMGFTSAPATEAIMGVVPAAKAGVGSAVNDATRLVGGTLGVAVIGSIYASLHGTRLTGLLPSATPRPLADTAHDSVGAALGVADGLAGDGRTDLADRAHDAATSAFFHGFSTANLVAAGVAATGALIAILLLPAHPTRTTSRAPARAQPAPAQLMRANQSDGGRQPGEQRSAAASRSQPRS